MWYISYWFWPVFSAFVWVAMLITMLCVWAKDGFPHYESMSPGQEIAYLSDIGASGIKPFFIAMSCVVVVSFNISFVLERWLRHKGRLERNTSTWQKAYAGISIVSVTGGGVGLICLSIFDTARHHDLHDDFLYLFLAGYILSAIFICAEYYRLGVHYREKSILRASFWIKLSFIIIEGSLAIAFGAMSQTNQYNEGAILEWCLCFFFFFYVLSFFIDFMPAIHTKHHQSRETEMDMRNSEKGNLAADSEGYFRGAPRNLPANGFTQNDRETNRYSNGNQYAGAFANGNANANSGAATQSVPVSHNF